MDNLIEAAKNKVRNLFASRPGKVISQFGSDLNRTLQNIGTGTGAALQTFVSQPLANIKVKNMENSQSLASQAMQEKIRQQQGLPSQQNIPYLLNQSRAYSNTPDFTASNLKFAESNLQKRIDTGTQQTGIAPFLKYAAPAVNVALTGKGLKTIGAMPMLQKAGTLGLSAGISGVAGALSGQNPLESAFAGILQTPRIVGLTGISSPATKYGAAGIMDKISSPLARNIMGRGLTGLGNVVEDEILSKLDNIKPGVADRVLSFGIGAFLAPIKEYEDYLKSEKPEIAQKIRQVVRDIQGRYAKKIGVSPESLNSFMTSSGRKIIKGEAPKMFGQDVEKISKFLEDNIPGAKQGFGNIAEPVGGNNAVMNADMSKGLTPEVNPEGKAKLRTMVEPVIDNKGKVEFKETTQSTKTGETTPTQAEQTLTEASQNLPLQQTIGEQLPVSSAKILPEKGKLNVENLNLNQSQKQAIRDLQANVPETVIGHQEIKDKAKLAKLRTKPITDAEQADIIARQLASRQQVTTLSNEYTKLQQSGASELELKAQLSKIADASRVAQQTGTFAGRLLEAQKIVANELATPMQRVFALLDNAGVDKSKYLDDATKIDFNNPTQVTEFYRKYVPPKLGEILDEVRYTNMLSSPNTQINNAASNFLMTGVVRPVTKTIAGTIDWAKNSLTGSERKYYASQGLDYAKGYYGALPEAWSKFKNVIKNVSSESKPDMERIPVFTKGIGKLYTTPLRLLEASDQFFRHLTKSGEIMSGMSIKEAEKSAEYQLFRQKFDPSGELGSNKVLQTFDKWNSFIQGARRLPGGNWILPFLQTPTNILKQGLEYSPLGVITAPGSKEPIEQLAKAAIGSTVFATAYGLANSGVTTWGAPSNQKEKDLFYAAGLQPYSIKIGDKWVSYSKLGPLSYPIAMAASLKDAADRNPDMNTIEQLQQGAVGTLGFFADQSYVRSIGDLVSAVQQGKGLSLDSLKSQMANFAGQLVPYGSFMSWLTRLTDPGTKHPEFGNISQKIQASIPGLSKNIPSYEGTPSQEIATINAFSPLRVSQEQPGKIDLYNAQKQNVIQSGMENRTQKQLERSGVGSQTTGRVIQYIDDNGTVKKLDYGKVLSLPETNSFEKAIKIKKAYTVVDDIVDADIPEDQKNQIYSQLGIKPQEAKYYRVAKEDNDIKTAYIMDKLGTLKSNDRKSMFEILVKGRLEVNKSKIVSDGVLDNLYEEDLLSKEEVKKLKALKINNVGGKPTIKLTGRGKTAKLKKLKYTPLKLKLKPLKKIKDFDVKSLKL